MVGYLKKYVSIQGYQFYIAITDNDIKEEAQVLEGLIQNKKQQVLYMYQSVMLRQIIKS